MGRHDHELRMIDQEMSVAPGDAEETALVQHKLEIGHGAHDKRFRCTTIYLNDYRICGGKPWGGFVPEYTFTISDADLRQALHHASTK